MLYSMVVVEAQGKRLERLIKKAGLTNYKLAQLSGVSRPLISLVISGKRVLKYEKAQLLAPHLKVTTQYLFDGTETEEESFERALGVIESVLRTAGKSDVGKQVNRIREVQRRGYVPGGYPLPNEQQDLGKVKVHKDDLGGASEVAGIFALTVTGDSMIGAGISPGFDVIINPNDKDFVDGKIYLVRVENEVTIKKVRIIEGKPVLQPCNSHYEDIKPDPDKTEIIGRVIWKGAPGESL